MNAWQVFGLAFSWIIFPAGILMWVLHLIHLMARNQNDQND